MAAKEIAIGKRAKITEAQQYILLSVLAASVVLGVAISLTIHFIQQIAFNAKVIMAEDEAIVSYSDVIKTTGICKSPKGQVYTKEELDKCDPDSIEVAEIPDTLRSNILEKLAANTALNSVPKESDSSCVNIETGQNYTYKELTEIYNQAKSNIEITNAVQMIKKCSALRIIPDALPSFMNEEALLASLNKLFIDSDWQPESISPGGSSSSNSESSSEEGVPTLSSGVNPLAVNLSVETDASTTMRVLNNVERSIREFDIDHASIEWSAGGLNLQAQATAYYVGKSSVSEVDKTVTADSDTTSSSGSMEIIDMEEGI